MEMEVWAQRQLKNFKGIENDGAAASHSAVGQTAAFNASAGRVAAGASGSHTFSNLASSSNQCGRMPCSSRSESGTSSSRTFSKRSSRHRKQLTMASTQGR